jgi:hypothetical protein
MVSVPPIYYGGKNTPIVSLWGTVKFRSYFFLIVRKKIKKRN